MDNFGSAAAQWSRLALEYWHISGAGLLLLMIAAAFLGRFVWPAFKLGGELGRAIAALRAVRSSAKGGAIDLDEIETRAMSGPALSHVWIEYAKTLHRPSRVDRNGSLEGVRWRATALAEMFFTEQSIVDTRLKTEFYKHLPGILTGIGIIGTFLGLIIGLSRFKVPRDLTLVTAQLEILIASVSHAFWVSAAAITLAMILTWWEKSLVTRRYREVETLRELVDSLFKGGAGEEYLERVANASETAATQALQLKDALVIDLRQILTELTTQQIEAQARHSGQMSTDVGKAITQGLGQPMEAIAQAVKGVSANQGDAINRMLTDVLASFSAQMREMFGGQMQGMADLLRETSESMRQTALQFGQLAANMDAAGTNTVDAMGERLNKALESMESRQKAMDAQTAAFVDQMRSVVDASQSETSKKLQDVLSAVGDQVAGVVAELRRQAELSTESHGQRLDGFQRAAGAAIGSLSAQVEGLLGRSVETNRALQDTVSKLSSSTATAIAEMKSGAATLNVAATEFAKAGSGVSETLRQSTATAEVIKSTAMELRSATEHARGIFADHARTKDVFGAMVSDLRVTIETAKRDASMTSELLSRIEAATAQLAVAQKQSEEYLDGVSQVLIKAHASFAENVERSLREGNRQFQDELSGAVQSLSGAIRSLGDVLDEMPAVGGR